MSENKSPIPPMNSIAQLIDYFETHDMGEVWDELPAADFEVRIGCRRHYVAIEEDLMPRLVELSRSRHISPQALINEWVRERVMS